MSFCDTCRKLKSDVDVTDIANRNFRIDGKSILGLMSIKLGLPMRLVVDGEDEELAHQYFTKYEFEVRRSVAGTGCKTLVLLCSIGVYRSFPTNVLIILNAVRCILGSVPFLPRLDISPDCINFW